MEEIFLGRQPILDRDQNIVAFELIFHSAQSTSAGPADNLAATANIIVNAYGRLGIQNVLGEQRGFINVDAELLMSDVLLLLPCKHVVLELMESIKISDEIVQRCIELKQMGYQLALNNITEINNETELLLPIVNVVKVNVHILDKEAINNIIEKLKPWPVLLLAQNVDDCEQAKYCLALGFQMFQGYYFAKPEIMTGKRADPAKLSLLKLLPLVVSGTNLDEIEKEFKHQPGLSYNLLRMVNSVASGLPRKVNSIKHAILILGQKQLQRWIQLLLYTADRRSGSMANALMQTAATRGKLMELISAVDRPHDKSYQDRAFMVGILSLLDALLGIEMPQIVDKLGITEDMSRALLQREGCLGNQLKLIEANEKGKIHVVQSILVELGFLNSTELTNLELEALGWANRIGETTD